MKTSYWIAIAIGALIVGILFGYRLWGQKATRLGEVEKELSAAQAEVNDFRKKTGDLEGNLGKMTNDKMNLEKEKADLLERLEKTADTKKSS